MIKTIIFDVDGTLLDSVWCAKTIYRQMILEEFGAEISDEDLMAGMKWPTRKALQVLGFPNIPEANHKYHTRLMKLFESVKIYKGMAETLQILKKRNIPLGVVTARNQSEMDDDTAFGCIRSYFDSTVCADDINKYKPDPGPLKLLLKQLNVKPDETLYIGDMYNDFLCAKNAGVDFGLALWGAETRDGFSARYYFDRPEEILEILDK